MICVAEVGSWYLETLAIKHIVTLVRDLVSSVASILNCLRVFCTVQKESYLGMYDNGK